MAKRKGMKFRTTQEKKTKQLRLFVLGFVGFLLAFALVSVAYMFKSHHLSMNDLFPEKEVESSDESTGDGCCLGTQDCGCSGCGVVGRRRGEGAASGG